MIPAVSPFLLLKSKCLGHGSPKMHGKILQSVDPEQWLIANDLLNYLQLYLLYSLIATNINIRLHIYIYYCESPRIGYMIPNYMKYIPFYPHDIPILGEISHDSRPRTTVIRAPGPNPCHRLSNPWLIKLVTV